MAKDSREPEDRIPSLLADIPPTDHAIIARMREELAENRHYAAIGRVAANWSYFEAVVDHCSIRLARVNKRTGIIFTSQISGIVRKMDAYIALARLRNLPSGIVSNLCKNADTSRGLSERRNRIVHDVWYFYHPGSPERFEASARRLLKVESVPTSTEELLQFAVDIQIHQATFEDLDLIVARAPIAPANTVRK
jgi:hypothetical protein